MNLRKLNMFVVILMLLVFLDHAIFGSIRMAGGNANVVKTEAWIGVGLVVVHVIITSIMGAETLKARRLSGVGYFKDNALFWTRRISGFVILIPLVMHLMIFTPANSDVYRLQVFTTGRLISQIFLVAALALHILTNVKPALITLGVRKDTKAFQIDLILVLSIMLLLFGIAFVIYYLRWMAM